ncbi:MAG: hypothetical protein JXR70_11085 [Spirochaetales bacterium]|nr:hypothetical protein [Spirochaetales bacterium]
MENRKSKLSAIMFSDIAGYSELMSKDENLALNLLDQHNRLLFPLIEEFNGKIARTMGDALLVDFNSALSAANCAMNIQRALANHNKSLASGQRIFLRAGIHIGDVWYNDSDVFGETVNIATRLEPFALPGGIALSKDMYQLLANKSQLEFRSLGKKTLKNINKEMEVYHLVTGCEIESKGRNESEQKSEHMAGQGNYQSSSAKKDEYTQWEEDPGKMLKNKVFTALNGFMDKAVQEWDKSSKNHKQHYVNKMRNANWFDQWSDREEKRMRLHEKIQLEKMRYKEERRVARMKSNNSLGMGIVATIGFGVALSVTGMNFLIFPLAFMGILPLISGIRRSFQRKWLSRQEENQARVSKKDKAKDIEKSILKVASNNKGRLTVLELANETDLSIEEAKSALDQMAAKGYVELKVSENGLILYEFPDFAHSHDDSEDFLAREIDKLDKNS